VFAPFDINPQPTPGFITDFHGARTRCSLLWDDFNAVDGTTRPIPVPCDYHAETIEWIGTLRSVLEARGSFTAMEVGAGIGPWLVASGVAARLRGLAPIRLTGIEGDPGRFAMMRENLGDNGFNPDAQTLIQGAAGSVAGTARWPVVRDPRNVAGARPLRVEEGSIAPKDLDYWYDGNPSDTIEVKVFAFSELLEREARWDLVHMDVQGGEAELCRSALATLTARVSRLVIGTHSRVLDGEVMATLHGAGWVLEAEKPTRFIFNSVLTSLERMTQHDGTQVWRNQKL